ncbi:hypothetical protein BDZ89DRAFT_1138984 [Hymenopellis radicata]|nr:hypothetical protein BDZ89DRAFT_1138984 [Hymenopellis radicata]
MLDIPDDLWVEFTRLYTPANFLRFLLIRNCQMYLTESFVDFISSCSILEGLHFTSFQFDQEEYDVAANTSLRTLTAHRFWFDALPRLASSIRELELMGPELSGLCIEDVEYVDALSECHLLEVLHIAVNTKVRVNTDPASAAQTRTFIHRILTTLCQNSWPVMRELWIHSCHPDHDVYIDRDIVKLLSLHNTEFESSTEQIFKTRIFIFKEYHGFKRVDGVVRFIDTELERQEHAGDDLRNTADVNQGTEDQSNGDGDAEESDMGYFLPQAWYLEPGSE